MKQKVPFRPYSLLWLKKKKDRKLSTRPPFVANGFFFSVTDAYDAYTGSSRGTKGPLHWRADRDHKITFFNGKLQIYFLSLYTFFFISYCLVS